MEEVLQSRRYGMKELTLNLPCQPCASVSVETLKRGLQPSTILPLLGRPMVCRRPRVQQASGDEEDVPVEVAQQLETPACCNCRNKCKLSAFFMQLAPESLFRWAFLDFAPLTEQVVGDDWPQQPPERSFGSSSPRLPFEDVQRIVVTDLKNFKGVTSARQPEFCHDGVTIAQPDVCDTCIPISRTHSVTRSARHVRARLNTFRFRSGMTSHALSIVQV